MVRDTSSVRDSDSFGGASTSGALRGQGEQLPPQTPEAVGGSLRPFDDEPNLRLILSLDEFVDVVFEALLQLLRSDGAAALKDALQLARIDGDLEQPGERLFQRVDEVVVQGRGQLPGIDE